MRTLGGMSRVAWVGFLIVGIWASLFQGIRGETNQEDVQALQQLYQGLNQPLLQGWNFANGGGDPCAEQWQGITCSGSGVTQIQLSGLQLGGQIWSLDRFKQLTILDLSNNQIAGQIPYNLPPNIQQLKLQKNGFMQTIPWSIGQLTQLTELSVANNNLTGSIPDNFLQLTSFTTADFSFNQLSGAIPKSFSNLTSLNALYLQNNQLNSGLENLQNLPEFQLQTLDISNNQFTGWIPAPLSSIPSLKSDGNPLNTSPAPPPPPSAPGTPPKKSPPPKKAPPPPKNEESSSFWSGGRIAGVAIAAILAIVAVILIVLFFKWRKREEAGVKEEDKTGNSSSWFGPLIPPAKEKSNTDAKSFFCAPGFLGEKDSKEEKLKASPPEKVLKVPPTGYKSVPPEVSSGRPSSVKSLRSNISASVYSVADLQVATNSFAQENLIGEGSLGRVYRADFPDGQVLAVKKLDTSAPVVQNEEDFLATVGNIARLRHVNITELVGYCSEHGQRLLVYEYISRGTLHDTLHLVDETSKRLSWNMRVKIALGAARALEYLHEVCLPSVVHRNFKSGNILLTDDMNPHLSDCGIAALIPYGSERQVSANMLGSFGYSAPEYAMSGTYTVKSDVYSFGVVMLELLTGRKPLDSSRPRNEQSLVRWAIPQLHDIDALSRMVDPALKGIYPAKSLSRFADIVALCVQPEPEFRPPMSEVVQALVRLMQRASLSKRRSGDDLGASQRSLDRHDHPSDHST
ncbi:hypothetical protein R1flu_015039 [Riccia fluitans]|uniref:Protein kinase domain-containing protein n=1 Tax=Riccia fluitans TaxID=41844 RepID=A0ABD1YI66_9MARC